MYNAMEHGILSPTNDTAAAGALSRPRRLRSLPQSAAGVVGAAPHQVKTIPNPPDGGYDRALAAQSVELFSCKEDAGGSTPPECFFREDAAELVKARGCRPRTHVVNVGGSSPSLPSSFWPSPAGELQADRLIGQGLWVTPGDVGSNPALLEAFSGSVQAAFSECVEMIIGCRLSSKLCGGSHLTI